MDGISPAQAKTGILKYNMQMSLILTPFFSDLLTWNLDALTTIKHRKFNFVTSKIEAFATVPSGFVRLFCIGQFQDMRVVDPISLVILFNLTSRISTDWVSAFTVFQLASKRENVVVAITQSAVAKVWTFSDSIVRCIVLVHFFCLILLFIDI